MKVVELKTMEGKVRYYLADNAGAPVAPVLKYLKFKDNAGYARNTLRMHCIHLKHFFAYLEEAGKEYERVNIDDIAGFLAWLKNPDILKKVVPMRFEPGHQPQTINVVKLACSLVGKVNYFWGGKSSEIRWDENWGKLMRVTSSESTSTGTIRPFAFDCSGFVAWAFINSNKDASYGNAIGYGTQNQYSKCTPISWQDSEPGDLAFYRDFSHVGIVVGHDTNGDILVIQCASGYNNVVLTTNRGLNYMQDQIFTGK